MRRSHNDHLSPEDRDELIRRYQSGERVTDLCAAFNISHASIYSFFRKQGISLRGNATTEPQPSWLTVDQVAEQLGVSRRQIRFFVENGGLTPCWPVGRKPHPCEWIYFEKADIDLFMTTRRITPKPQRIEQFDLFEAAYLAGLFDGEGSVCISRPCPSSNRYGMRISISNTHEGVILWVHERFGGWTGSYDRPSPQKRIHVWCSSGPPAASVLELMLPFLIIKKTQAALVIEFQQRIDAYRGSWRRKLTPEEREWRDRQADMINILNVGKRSPKSMSATDPVPIETITPQNWP